MLRSIPDMSKFKQLYDSIALNMSINEKEYQYSIFLERSTVDKIVDECPLGNRFIQLVYDIKGNLIKMYADDEEIEV